ncbi:uncharacterized protein LOC123293363 [Chrysoperla carnea]|uniref:uncharacterized protein LOC123293363 n=1 Tax=Chrysoperla carnea TaxID=189513 RepID=UPI001D071974|nr:uncharacterized protein LOC123293363 [Chrysoperla carnea]
MSSVLLGAGEYRNRRSRRLASTRGIKWHNSDLDVYHTNDDINFSGWIRLFAGPDYGDETNISSLLEIDLDTTVYDLVTLLCLPNELTIYKQIGGSESERLNENTTLLEEQNEFLKVLGFSDHTRRKRLGVDPDLCHLINFHLGPAVPLKHLSGFKTCGSVYVLKGLVFPQWKLRPMTILGPILFIFPGNVDGTPEEIDLRNAQIVVAENRNGRFVLQLSPSTGPCTNKSEVVHLPLRQIYLGFDRLWERNLWQSWLLRATSSSVITVIARNERSTDHMNNELDKEEDNNINVKNNKEENEEECLKKKKDSIRIDLSGSALEQIPDSMWHSLITIATSIATEDDNDSSTIMSEIKHNNRIPSPPPLPMVITTINGSNNNSSSITLGSGKSTIPSSSTIIQTNSCNNKNNNKDILVNGDNTTTTTTKQVEEIDLAYNKLSEDVALKPLTLYVNNTLRSLRLTANSIRTFPTCLFECKLLMKLDLCDNQLNYVPKDLSKLEK